MEFCIKDPNQENNTTQTNKQEERKATKTLYGIITECDTHASFDVDFKSLH